MFVRTETEYFKKMLNKPTFGEHIRSILFPKNSLKGNKPIDRL